MPCISLRANRVVVAAQRNAPSVASRSGRLDQFVSRSSRLDQIFSRSRRLNEFSESRRGPSTEFLAFSGHWSGGAWRGGGGRRVVQQQSARRRRTRGGGSLVGSRGPRRRAPVRPAESQPEQRGHRRRR